MTRIDGEITIAAPVEQVFDLVVDERNEPRYNPRIVRAEKTSDGPVGKGSRFVVRPKRTGTRGEMRTEVTDFDRPRRFGSSVTSSSMAVDGTVTFTPVDGGTLLHWSWDMRLRGPMRVMTPVLRVVGPAWERRNWVGLKQYVESGAR